MSEQIRRPRPTRACLQRSRMSGRSDSRRYESRVRRAHHGQTLIVALSVLFILLFIGGIFVTRVSRNLSDSARGRDIADARALAEAGLKYCDNELNGSEEGADWRPQPTAPLANGNNGGVTDPDYFWLEKGFTRLDLKGGRALVRVSYDPDPANPIGQAIKIESVGRTGELDPGDPTVFVQNQPSPRLRRELIAYKRIGITDYLRFMTDKEHRGGENFLGVPAIGHYFPMVFGNPMLAISQYAGGTNQGETLYGGSIYCNSNLSIMGDAYFYEGPRGVYNPTNGNGDPALPQEGIFVAGNLSANQFSDPSIPQLSSYASATATRFDPTTKKPMQQANLNVPIDGSPSFTVGGQPYGGPITPTNDYNTTTKQFGPNPLFNTYGGKQRDGSVQSASNGSTRAITRLNPPSIDTNLSDTGKLRIRAMTSESGRWISSAFNTGMAGWGRAVYVDNKADKQEETLTPGITGSYSLPADWTNPNAGFAQSGWHGPYYRPPGVLIELLGDRMRLTRTDGKPFVGPQGQGVTAQGIGSIIEIPFSDADRDDPKLNAPHYPHDGDEPYTGSGSDPRSSGDSKFTIDPHSYGVNLVLFAEGNIRVKGVFGTLTDLSKSIAQLSRVHLTLITGGTAYIEGNLIKGDGTVSGAAVTLQRNSTCQIIAKDYVCVNTSMFVQPQNQTNAWPRDPSAGFDEFYTTIGMERTTYDTTFSNGISPTSYNVGQMLFLRHAAMTPGPTAINLLINPAQDNGQGSTAYIWHYGLDVNEPYPNGNPIISRTYPLGKRTFNGVEIADDSATSPRFEAKAFGPLDKTPNTNDAASYTIYPGYDNLFRLQIDQTLAASQNGLSSVTGLQSYLLSAIAVAPLDIRIEAALYAQDKSFFIIPGYSFNPDPNDTRAAYTASGQRTSYKVNLAANPPSVEESNTDKTEKDRFPYHNEPLDVRITFCGAIAENYTANIGAQAAWLSRWGYTAATYGSTGGSPGSTPQSIPDDHLKARQPAASPNLPVGYVAGDPGTLDYRSQLESQTDGNTPHANDFALTRALLFEYDPALAMPYFHSSDASLTGTSNRNLRLARALRFTQRTVPFGGTNKVFRQLLPPMPRLPIGPDLIYSGASDALVGENQFDTDLYTGP